MRHILSAQTYSVFFFFVFPFARRSGVRLRGPLTGFSVVTLDIDQQESRMCGIIAHVDDARTVALVFFPAEYPANDDSDSQLQSNYHDLAEGLLVTVHLAVGGADDDGGPAVLTEADVLYGLRHTHWFLRKVKEYMQVSFCVVVPPVYLNFLYPDQYHVSPYSDRDAWHYLKNLPSVYTSDTIKRQLFRRFGPESAWAPWLERSSCNGIENLRPGSLGDAVELALHVASFILSIKLFVTSFTNYCLGYPVDTVAKRGLPRLRRALFSMTASLRDIESVHERVRGVSSAVAGAALLRAKGQEKHNPSGYEKKVAAYLLAQYFPLLVGQFRKYNEGCKCIYVEVLRIKQLKDHSCKHADMLTDTVASLRKM